MASRQLMDADEKLRNAWLDILWQYEDQHPGLSAIITCTYRSPEEQQELYAQGRTKPGPVVTYCDGVTKMSKHNSLPSRALDFAVVVNGKVSWEPGQYEPVGILAEAQGFVWGGRWKMKDYPHIEVAA